MKKLLLVMMLIFLGASTYACDIKLEELSEEQKSAIMVELYLSQVQESANDVHEELYSGDSSAQIIDRIEVPKNNVMYIVKIRGQYFIVDPFYMDTGRNISTTITPLN